jgi:putative endonuclease
MPETSYVVYLLECADGTLYTGVTTDIARRVAEHNEGEKGAKYTRARRPVKVVYEETCASRSEAQKREAEIRKLSRGEKLALAQS